jgi:hypothetical protein
MTHFEAVMVKLWVFLILGIATLAFGQSPSYAVPPELHVFGNHLVDKYGKFVRLQGANIPSLEWSSTGEHVSQSIDVAINDWHATIIRIPLSLDRWFGKTDDSLPV